MNYFILKKMDTKELFAAVKMLEQEKNIPADILCERIQAAIVSAIKGEYGRDIGYCDIDLEEGSMAVYLRKNVVSEIVDPITDLLPEEAQRYKKGAVPGDIVEIQLETKDFSRIAASTTKNVIRQGIKEAEKAQLFADMQGKAKELVTGIVQRISEKSGAAILQIGSNEFVLPREEMIPGEEIKVGDHIRVYVVDVISTDRGPKIMLSRTHPGFVSRMFELEVPEIFDGTVEIKAISREAGARTKMAVWSKDENVDAIGACIGTKRSRIENVIAQIGGEKIDIVKWSEDPAAFISAALSPSQVISVEILSQQPKSCRVTVPDEQLSLAIGNKGQNARLAARLTGYNIDIHPESGYFGE